MIVRTARRGMSRVVDSLIALVALTLLCFSGASKLAIAISICVGLGVAISLVLGKPASVLMTFVHSVAGSFLGAIVGVALFVYVLPHPPLGPNQYVKLGPDRLDYLVIVTIGAELIGMPVGVMATAVHVVASGIRFGKSESTNRISWSSVASQVALGVSLVLFILRVA